MHFTQVTNTLVQPVMYVTSYYLSTQHDLESGQQIFLVFPWSNSAQPGRGRDLTLN
jgi:hypothetical protein